MNFIETDRLSFRYTARSSLVVNNVSLQVPERSIYGFLGHNGAGKTTTIRLLLGLLRGQGTIRIFGQDLKMYKQRILQGTGALIEDPSLYGHLTAAENLRINGFYRNVSSSSRITEMLRTVRLDEHAHHQVKKFSTGMKQRLGLAVALLHDPELIILDEPTNGLDPQGMLEMRQLIIALNEQEGKTIFLSSHLLHEVEKTCTHVGIIRKGEMLFQGSINELKARQEGMLEVWIETDNDTAALQLLKTNNIHAFPSHNSLKVRLADRAAIPLVIDLLRNNSVGIYQVKTDHKSLEDVFFHLHDEQGGKP